MDFKHEIEKLQLPEDSFVVVGSGILGVLGIRESNDIDLVVDKVVYDSFENRGWDKGSWSDQVVFRRGVFDIGYDWYGQSAKDLLFKAEVIDGVPYLSLDEVYEWKKLKGREKDLRDIELINRYRGAQ